MPGGERRYADHMHVVLDRLARGFRRRRKQRPDVHVEAEVRESRRDHLLPTVVAVLPDLGDEDARTAALVGLERRNQLQHTRNGVGHADLPLVDARERLDLGAVAPEHFFQRHRDFADGRLGARRLDRERQQVAVAAVCRARQCRERLLDRLRIALGFQPRELVELQRPHRRVVDLEHVDRLFICRAIFVHADDRLRAAIDAALSLRGGLLDAQLRNAGLDRLGHAAELFDFLNVAPGLLREFGGEAFDVERAAPRIGDARGAALLAQEQLRIARDAGGEIGRQRQRLVERVGVQRLGVPLRRRHRLDRGAYHVVVDVLRRQGPA